MAFLFGGGQQTSAPTNQTITNTNIPTYAQPYVESMLGATQNQLFNYATDPSTGAMTVTGIKPYQAFGAPSGQTDANGNPVLTGLGQGEMQAANAAVAPFSALQNQSFQGAQNLQMPGTFQQGADVTGQGIMGALGTAQQARGINRLGYQAANAGNQYAEQATNPYETQAYMSPYLQASLAPQMQLLQQQQAQQGQQLAGNAVQSGAFGGSRYGIQQGLQNQANQLAMSNLVGQGYNTAFNNAQQAQQFGANLGLQGLQAGMQGINSGINTQLNAYNQAMQGGNQLANIGNQQLQAEQGILGLQNQLGTQQQTQNQNVLNQAIQNYTNTQQFPQQQLAFMNAQLRGLPLSSTNTTSYQAPPSAISQLAGLGMGAYTLNKMKKGGSIKSKAPDNRQRNPGGLMDLALDKIGA